MRDPDHTVPFRLLDIWLMQRGFLFPWAPVLFGVGVGGYFALRFEPPLWAYAICIAMCLILVSFIVFRRSLAAPLAWGIFLVLAGVCAAGLRAHSVEEPVLGWRYYGPIEGRIVGIDRSSSDAVRLTLDQVVLARMPPSSTPSRIRISMHGDRDHILPAPGQIVVTTGHLSPPSGPVEPGGFDFQRHAWFQGLGAVGYTRNPVLLLAPPDGGQWLFTSRMWLADRVKARLPGETGGFAAAIMAGDRSGIDQDTLTALRVSNLAHLLAISGLHMALLTGFVFSSLRLGFAAVPRVGLRVPAKKVSAVGALIAGGGYLALSGGNVATERAFIMVGVMFCAILVDRRALSLRAVAIAALLVLAVQPEAMLGPGFQMSFAATTALVAVFNLVREYEFSLGHRWLQPVFALFLSSLVAGLATAPIAAAHFNQIAHYGLIANLLSVPLMGVLVIPSAVLAACLMPFGLDFLALWAMGFGLDWILGVATWVSSLDGARGMVPTPGTSVLPMIALGALFVILWQGRWRVLGTVPILAGFAVWAMTDRPAVLISDTGSLVGVMTDNGRALNREQGAGFVALNWLENDGDPRSQATAFGQWTDEVATTWPLVALRGQKAADGISNCEGLQWIVLNKDPETVPDLQDCSVVTPSTLRRTGSIALFERDGHLEPVTARQISGTRLWNDQ